MDYFKYRELLIVNHENTIFVVDVPAHEANVGDLVSFEDPFGFINIGDVVDKMWAEKDKDIYRCVEYLRPICKGVKIFRTSWEMKQEAGPSENV